MERQAPDSSAVAPIDSEGAPGLDEQARRAYFKAANAMTPYLSVMVGEQTFFVSTDDRGIGKELFTKRRARGTGPLARAVDLLSQCGIAIAGTGFVEVGGNIGTTTVAALCSHGFATAVVLEPSPVNFETLRINLAANGLSDRVRPIAAAASDREGEVAFKVADQHFGSHHVAGHAGLPGHVGVPAVTLDSLVTRGVIHPDTVGLLWVDAVGHEPEALAGGSRLIGTSVPLVLRIRGGDRTWRRLFETLVRAYTHAIDLKTIEKVPVEDLQVGLVREKSRRVLFLSTSRSR